MTPALTITNGELAGKDRRHFDVISTIARSEAGLVIPPEKAPMVFARLAKRLRSLGLSDAGAYCEFITGPDGDRERRHLISALTTNVTSFFREMHHFEYLKAQVLPELQRRARRGERIRIWSAGCSNGSEPYSIAMTVLDAFPDAAEHDVRILATDIDSQILETARKGHFEEDRFEPIPTAYRMRFLKSCADADGTAKRLQITDELRRIVRFRELNLLGDWPMRHPFDVIFCRNVVIYFDQETQERLWPRFEAACKPSAHLFLGHSERLPPAFHGTLRPVATTTYRRHIPSNCATPA
ncbi:CheR family methyltransferase [Tropicimonas marinistellae]|uniref:CheR family methyltransferase n=1 Tax=Tropicimonas marinistellae TaxID=1739787 RepID=UPI0008349C49|nr:protein-glutamate O-methyltransferase [Tropicimonas marinistellae]